MLYGKTFQVRQSGCKAKGWVALGLILILAGSCAKAPVITQPIHFYIIPEITYLRESPGYEERVLSQLNRGDQVDLLEDGDSSWWRVQQVSSGQIGWVQKALLSSEPISGRFYYVNLDNIPLRDSPRNDGQTLKLLSRGDRVNKFDENHQGWWRVQASGSGILGWLPAAALTEQFANTQSMQPQKEYYYVAVNKLGLRAKPWIKDEIIRNLQFNEQVQKIAQNSQGWFKVRLPADGALGWVISRYLEPLPLTAPRSEAPTKAKSRQLKQRQGQTTEPEIM